LGDRRVAQLREGQLHAPIQLDDAPPGCILVDLLDGLSEHALDTKGRIERGLNAYGYRWLRLLRPQDNPII
jgi:hypothetical protein